VSTPAPLDNALLWNGRLLLTRCSPHPLPLNGYSDTRMPSAHRILPCQIPASTTTVRAVLRTFLTTAQDLHALTLTSRGDSYAFRDLQVGARLHSATNRERRLR
jgi:hypothetical protein